MFLENNIYPNKRKGSIEVICGSMFSGKTEELIRRMKRAQYAKQKVEIFKPEIDTRYDAVKVVSHEGNSIHSTRVPWSSHTMLSAHVVEVVGMSGAQMCDAGFTDV